jgi:hypothetical protein
MKAFSERASERLSDSTDLQIPRSPDGTEELRETLSLVQVMHLVIENYTRVSAGTGDEQVVRRAARRVEEALLGCQRTATKELAAGLKAGSFDCSFCGADHDLDRDLQEFREKGEVSAVLLMRKFRYRFDHAARAIKELETRGFVEFAGPSLVLVDPPPAGTEGRA